MDKKLDEVAKMSDIKVGDYVNGYQVEDIQMISGEPHYLITYFQCAIRKPQTLMLAKSKVKNLVKKEDFEKQAQSIMKEVLNVNSKR